MAKATVIYDRFYNRIDTALKSTSNLTQLKQFYGEVISRNNEALSSIIPDKAIYMDPKIEKKFYDALNIDPKEILQAVKDSPDIENHWHTIKNPMYISLTLLMLYFYNVKKTELAQQSIFICSLYMYRNIRSKYFRRTSEATINVMNYTISRLTYKNDIKKYGSIMNTLSKKSINFYDNWVETHKSEITGKILDDTILRMINDNHRRYVTLLNNFYAEFKKDSTEGNYLNVNVDIDDGDTYIQSDNVSFMVEKNTQAVMSKFILTSYPNPDILKHTSQIEPGCSINNLRNMVMYLYDGHDKDVERLTRLILQIFLFEYKKNVEDIRSMDFITIMRNHYKKQSASDANLNEMKDIINEVVDKSGVGKKITRAATLNDCKRALLLYILFLIQRSLL
jgi:hypothetical protein